MNEWDSTEVYKFLKGYYWPERKIGDVGSGEGERGGGATTLHNNGKHVHGEMSIEGEPLSPCGFYCTIMPFVIMICYFVKQYVSNKKGMYSMALHFRTKKNKFF